IGDGVSLVRFLLELTDPVPAEGGDAAPAQKAVTPGVPRPPLPKTPWGLGRLAVDHTTALGRLLTLPADPPTALRGPLGHARGVAWPRAFSQTALGSAAHAVGARLNDALVAIAAGALRRYLGAGCDVAELRALVPIFVRGESPDGGLGNHFGLVF